MRRFALVSICLFFSLSTALAAVPAAERSALVALYNATNGPAWNNHSNWLSGDPCDNEWYGIYCESRTNVNRIDLYGNNLVGTIPIELGNLGKLEILWLHRNELSGSIPAALGNLANVNTIWLWENDLVGTIPIELGNLGKLETLELQSNQLSGSIPAALGDLTKLKTLKLHRNQLSGSMPAALGGLANLDWLDLSHNELTGMLPTTLGNLSMLRYLDLSYNKLSGVIPSSLGNLGKLYLLRLSDNMLSGSIPTTFGNLANLIYLYLYDNSLSGQIPASIVKLAKLNTLDLDSNQLSGPIPSDLDKLTALRSLDLYKNQLSGAIPVSLGNLSMLFGLSLGSNQLTGEIPAVLGNMTSLSGLGLSNNQLSGAIPETLGTLTNLGSLYLNDNQLSGVIPTTLGNLKKLSGLDLENNQLSGPIPETLGNLSELRELNLQNNQLSGPIPASLGKLDKASSLKLSNNQLSGTIPSALGDMSNMWRLSLHDNKLSGRIPTSLANLTKMKYLNLNGNKLSGPIPAGFINLTELKADLNWNALYTNNPDLDDFLDTQSWSNWSSTQTIPPKSLRVTNVGSNSVSLAWKPIEYTADGGGYRVWYATELGGPYMDGGFKANKNSISHTVTGLAPGQKYYFKVKSKTARHSDNANIVNSVNSVKVFGQTMPTPSIQMNAGLNDAWFYPVTNGQGFFITVFPDIEYVSLSWFTYDTERPPEEVTANLGDPGHRWLMALGPYSGNQAVMDISMTSGGIFDTPTEVTEVKDGTIVLTFSNCENGLIEYDIPSINQQGVVPIQRVVGDNIALCEAFEANTIAQQSDTKQKTDDVGTLSWDVPVTVPEASPLVEMNAGLNDAWFYSVTEGQGFFINVFPDIEYVLLSWFTYDTEHPPEDVTANLGDPGHRWLNALGPYTGVQSVMDITIASGGIFDTSTEITEVKDGTITLTFSDCENGLIEYDIPSIKQQGTIPIERVVGDNIALCEALSSD